MKTVIGQQLEYYIMEVAKFTLLKDYAFKIGISEQYLGRIIKKNVNISLAFIKKIKNYDPDLNLNWLIFGQGPVKLDKDGNMLNEEKGVYKKECLKCDEKQIIISDLRDLNSSLKENLHHCKSELQKFQNIDKKGKVG